MLYPAELRGRCCADDLPPCTSPSSARPADANRLCRELQRTDAGQFLNESLFFGIDLARSAIAEWREGFNTARPRSSLGYQTPAEALIAAG
ncbi:integrase core domain-containing protein [Oricola indica]|uniref:integrase core domain-containing protein n=1 Tax=Oricola indica TaxID=2872591 RepID=UPI003CCC36D7